MNGKEFIDWFLSHPEFLEAKIQVIKVKESDYYNQSGIPVSEDFTPELSDYTDWSKNKFAKGKPYENDITLLLGEID